MSLPTEYSTHPLTLASGTLPEFDPVTIVEAAAAAGFDGCGVWYDVATWTAQRTQETAAAFRATGLIPLEVEVLIVGDAWQPDHAEPLLAAGAAIGCTQAIVVSTDPDLSRFATAFARLCEIAASYNINACLEFLPIFSIARLDQALEVLNVVQQPNARLLLDPIHVARSGASSEQLLGTDPTLISFAQFCDGLAELPGLEGLTGQARWEALREDAVDGRSCPGEGSLDLHGFMAALPPGVPLSMELRSSALRERFPDATARARQACEITRRWLVQASGQTQNV